MPVVTLVNLGGPRDASEIEPFLRDLFLDPYLFDLPLWEPLRKKLARFIAVKRAPRVAQAYASMGFGGGSPLVEETEKQAKSLADLLSQSTGKTWTGRVAMTCGFPNIRDLSIDELTPSDENVFLPLFPQFSRSTTMSLGNIIQEITSSCPLGRKGWVDGFSNQDRFAKLSAELIHFAFLGKLPTKDFIHYHNESPIEDWQNYDLVFSAHGIPMRLIKKGDRYKEEIEQSVRNIEKELRILGFQGRVHISFQSRVGPAKWTEPNTIKVMEELGKAKRNIAIYPISFLSDHLETLEEIGSQLKDIALQAGALHFFRIPAFGIYPPFLNYLKDLVLESLQKREKQECLCLLQGGEKLVPNCGK